MVEKEVGQKYKACSTFHNNPKNINYSDPLDIKYTADWLG